MTTHGPRLKDLLHEVVIHEPGVFDAEPGDNNLSPDLVFPEFNEVDIDKLAGLHAPHVLLDVDGTLVPQGDLDRDVEGATIEKIQQIRNDGRFATVSLATENGSRHEKLLHRLGMPADTAVFQPWKDDEDRLSAPLWKTSEDYWYGILSELNCSNNPNEVVVIGNSLRRDIALPRQLGMRTVLVGTLELVLRPKEAILADMRARS